MIMYEVIDVEYNTSVCCGFNNEAVKVAAAIAHNKYHNCDLTMSQLVKIFTEHQRFKTICIKEIYII